MKILIFTTNFPLLDGGVAPYSYELAKGLAEANHEVLVLTQRFTEKDLEFDAKQPITIIRVRRFSNRLIEMVHLFFHLTMSLITFRPQLVFPTAWLPCGLIMYPYAKLLGIPMIITAYALEVIAPQRRRWTRRIMKEVLQSSLHLIAISHYTCEQLLKLGLNAKHISVFPMGIDPVQFFEVDTKALVETYQLQDKQVILTLARLVERKGQDMVLRAMPAVLQKFPNAIYMIAGKGPDEARLKELAHDLAITDHVIFTGYIDDQLINHYYQLCDIYIMPSRVLEERGDAEGFGITFLEANLFGKPVIGGRSGGIVDAVEDGISGILVDSLSLEDITKAILMLLSDNELQARLGMQGRERAKKQFNWQLIIAEHNKLLQRLFAQI